jgi:predicted lipoprotein with Yx(FWY)xxD motif
VRSLNKFLIPLALGSSLLVAACGGSSPHSSSTAANATAPASKPDSSSAKTAVTIGTASSSIGTYLTGASGRALYLWVADKPDKSACSGSCAQYWPPVTASSVPKVAGAVNAGDISLITRPGGSKQVAYKGHPLYYFIADTSAGMTSGEGNDGFGAKWWLVSPSGTQVTTSGRAASTSGGAASTY